MMHIADLLSVERPNASTRFAQGGVKYRTLCATCNNDLLGHRYDPTLVTLSRDVRALLDTKLLLPPEIHIRTKPNRLVRSVVGHLLAFGVGQHRDGSANESLTDFLLDETLPFPSGLRLYYWLYPFNDQVLVRHAGLSFQYANDLAPFMLLKFFPLAFFLVVNEPPTWRIPYRRVDPQVGGDIDLDAMLTIELRNIPHQRWPEAPRDTGVVFYGEGAGAAIAR